MTDRITGVPVPAGGARPGAAFAAWRVVLLIGLTVGVGPAAAVTSGPDAGSVKPAPPAVTPAPRALSGVAVAEPVEGSLSMAPGVTAVVTLPPPHRFGTPVPDGGLAHQRGGAALPSSEMKLDGAVGNNAATNVVTGANIISDGAFSNASGLPMVIQNSGANVLIQNATIVNVQFE